MFLYIFNLYCIVYWFYIVYKLTSILILKIRAPYPPANSFIKVGWPSYLNTGFGATGFIHKHNLNCVDTWTPIVVTLQCMYSYCGISIISFHHHWPKSINHVRPDVTPSNRAYRVTAVRIYVIILFHINTCMVAVVMLCGPCTRLEDRDVKVVRLKIIFPTANRESSEHVASAAMALRFWQGTVTSNTIYFLTSSIMVVRVFR